MMRFVLDASLFIDASRSVQKADELRRFYEGFLPFVYLSSVVIMELLARTRRNAVRTLERNLIEPFERRRRVLTPSHAAFRSAGRVLEALGRSGLDLNRAPRRVAGDILIATSCREAGATLVTANRRDFERIRTVLSGFEHTGPWPER